MKKLTIKKAPFPHDYSTILVNHKTINQKGGNGKDRNYTKMLPLRTDKRGDNFDFVHCDRVVQSLNQSLSIFY
jgi:hypothetical protein